MPPSVPSLDLDRLDGEAVTLGEASVHAEQIGGEEARLVAAGAGADLENGIPVVVRVAREQQRPQLGAAAR